MRRSRFILIVALIIAIIYAVFNKFYPNSGQVVKTINENEEILADYTKLSDGLERYNTVIYLKRGEDNLNGIVELEVIAKVKYNKEEKIFEMENPSFKINPIACTLSEKNGEKYERDKLIGYYRFSLKKNEEFSGVMTVSSAKALQENEDITIDEINDSLDSGITSLNILGKTKGSDKSIDLSYKNNKQYFDIWYEISFYIDENKDGYFKIF